MFSREIFGWFKDQLDRNELTPMEMAMAYYYVHRSSYSGMGTSYVPQIVMPRDRDSKARPTRKFNEENIIEVSRRVQNVVFECLPFQRLFTRVYMNRPDTLLYLDPPYLHGGHIYEKMTGGSKWTLDDLREMCELVKDIDSMVCISYDTDLSDELPGDKWIRRKIQRLNSRQKNIEGAGLERQKATEYIITNYDISKMSHQIDKSEKSLTDFL